MQVNIKNRVSRTGILMLKNEETEPMKKSTLTCKCSPLFMLLSCFFFACLPAVYAQTMNRNFPAESLNSRLQKIAQQSKVTITYDSRLIDRTSVGRLQSNSQNVEEILKQSLRDTDFDYKKQDATTYVIVKRIPEKQSVKPKGTLSGKVLDEKGQPVFSATLLLQGTEIGTDTDENGDFIITGVPEGEYTLEASLLGYSKLMVNEVKIKEATTTLLNLVLKEDYGQLNELVITVNYAKASAEGLYNRQKNMVSLSDGISADMIKKTNDNNVGEVLKRVSGIVMEKDGKFVNIRGLGDRYNNMQLNGSTLPSTEANTKNFSFDMIPSSLIDNVVINKTFTPDLPAEFVGGLVNVSTLSVPKKSFFDFTMGTGFNTLSFNKDFWSGKRYNSDWFLGNMKDRMWYGTVFDPKQYEAWNNERHNINITPERKTELEQLIFDKNAQIPNRFGLKKYSGDPNTNYAVSFGTPFHLNDGSTLGLVMAATYRNEQNTQELKEAHYRTYGNRSYLGTKHDFTTWVGGIANLGWETAGHKITWYNLYNNKFTNEGNRVFVSNANEQLWMEQFSSALRNSLYQTKLEGEHQLGDDTIKISWMADYNNVKRQAPDERLIAVRVASKAVNNPDGTNAFTSHNLDPLYTDNGNVITYGSTWGEINQGNAFGSGYIRHNEYTEDKKNAALNFELPLLVNDNKQVLKAGYYGTFRKAHYEQLSLRPEASGLVLNEQLNNNALSVEEFFAQEHFKNGWIEYNPYFGRSIQADQLRDYYDGDQKLHAAYVNAEMAFWGKLRVSGGVRMEANNMSILTNAAVPGSAVITDTLIANKNTRFFPSASIIYTIAQDFNVRAAYSKTIARPDFNELSSMAYYDVYERSMVFSEKLTDTNIRNYDVRFEWYPASGEVISLGGFYKEFENPVEMISRDLDAGNYEFKKINIPNAKVKGIELNVRKSFAFISSSDFFRNLYVGGNITFLKGTVNYDLEKMKQENSGFTGDDPDNFRDRPLQGLAPAIYNGSLAYDGAYLGASVNYGRVGRRATITGVKAYLDEYENPRNILDLQLSGRFFKNRLEVKANAADILNEPVIRYVNMGYGGADETDLTHDLSYNKGKDMPRTKYKRGVTYSINLTYKF